MLDGKCCVPSWADANQMIDEPSLLWHVQQSKVSWAAQLAELQTGMRRRQTQSCASDQAYLRSHASSGTGDVLSVPQGSSFVFSPMHAARRCISDWTSWVVIARRPHSQGD